MSKAKRGGIPLEEVRELSYSIEDGPVVVRFRSRGFLRDIDVRDMKDTLHKPVFRPEGKEALEALADRLRSHLDDKELPTDHWPVTPIDCDRGYSPEEHGIVAEEDLWFGVAQDSTEPLTEDRLSAELLHATKRLLATFKGDQLSDIFRAMYLYHLHSAAGKLNELAVAGETSKKARARGPQVKKETARTQRKLILTIAFDFWGRHPQLQGQNFNTAKKIAEAVNEARSIQFPGCAPLAPKTISDQLRRALEEAHVQQ